MKLLHKIKIFDGFCPVMHSFLYTFHNLNSSSESVTWKLFQCLPRPSTFPSPEIYATPDGPHELLVRENIPDHRGDISHELFSLLQAVIPP